MKSHEVMIAEAGHPLVVQTAATSALHHLDHWEAMGGKLFMCSTCSQNFASGLLLHNYWTVMDKEKLISSTSHHGYLRSSACSHPMRGHDLTGDPAFHSLVQNEFSAEKCRGRLTKRLCLQQKMFSKLMNAKESAFERKVKETLFKKVDL